jgi:hypothetical protein
MESLAPANAKLLGLNAEALPEILDLETTQHKKWKKLLGLDHYCRILDC